MGGDFVANAIASANWDERGPLAVSASAAFASLLRHYVSSQRSFRVRGEDAVEAASEIVLACGAPEPPAISPRLAADLGLSRLNQLRLVGSDERGDELQAASSVFST